MTVEKLENEEITEKVNNETSEEENTPKWTKEQTSAIETRNKTLLVSAAAGAGKTATLKERIIRTLKEDENADISRMVIVTFTQAAAGEMRERISRALTEEVAKNPSPHLSRQLLLLPSAQISTIHSFCSSIIRENISELKVGLTPDFRICEKNERALLCRELMEDIIEECYESEQICNGADFCEFVDNAVPAKQSDALADLLVKIYEKCSSFEKKTEQIAVMRDFFLLEDGKYKTDRIFEENKEKPEWTDNYFSSVTGAYIKNYLLSGLRHYEKLYDRNIKDMSLYSEAEYIEKHLSRYEDDLRLTRELIELLCEGDYEKCKDKFTNVKFESLKSVQNAGM